jgi:hypothetical protein
MEVGELTELGATLENVMLVPGRQDIRIWKSSLQELLLQILFQKINGQPFSYYCWPLSCNLEGQRTSQVQVLAWIMSEGRMSTCDVVQRRCPSWCLSSHWRLMCK